MTFMLLLKFIFILLFITIFILLILLLTKLFIFRDSYHNNNNNRVNNNNHHEFSLPNITLLSSSSNIDIKNDNDDMNDLIITPTYTRYQSLTQNSPNNNNNKSPTSIWKIFNNKERNEEIDGNVNKNKRVLSQAFLTEGFL